MVTLNCDIIGSMSLDQDGHKWQELKSIRLDVRVAYDTGKFLKSWRIGAVESDHIYRAYL